MNFATWTRMLMRELMDSAATGQQTLTSGSVVTSSAIASSWVLCFSGRSRPPMTPVFSGI